MPRSDIHATHTPQLDLRKLPISVRKEVLLARALVERIEFSEATAQVRAAARPGELLRTIVGGSRQPATLWKAWQWVRRHPLSSPLASVLLAGLRKTSVGRTTWQLAKVGGIAALGWWAAKRIGEAQAERETLDA